MDLLTCLTSQQARECESNCLHTLADLIGPVRRCPHCGEDIHRPDTPPHTPPRLVKVTEFSIPGTLGVGEPPVGVLQKPNHDGKKVIGQILLDVVAG